MQFFDLQVSFLLPLNQDALDSAKWNTTHTYFRILQHIPRSKFNGTILRYGQHSINAYGESAAAHCENYIANNPCLNFDDDDVSDFCTGIGSTVIQLMTQIVKKTPDVPAERPFGCHDLSESVRNKFFYWTTTRRSGIKHNIPVGNEC